jgi:hypothetical protein
MLLHNSHQYEILFINMATINTGGAVLQIEYVMIHGQVTSSLQKQNYVFHHHHQKQQQSLS